MCRFAVRQHGEAPRALPTQLAENLEALFDDEPNADLMDDLLALLADAGNGCHDVSTVQVGGPGLPMGWAPTVGSVPSAPAPALPPPPIKPHQPHFQGAHVYPQQFGAAQQQQQQQAAFTAHHHQQQQQQAAFTAHQQRHRFAGAVPLQRPSTADVIASVMGAASTLPPLLVPDVVLAPMPPLPECTGAARSWGQGEEAEERSERVKKRRRSRQRRTGYIGSLERENEELKSENGRLRAELIRSSNNCSAGGSMTCSLGAGAGTSATAVAGTAPRGSSPSTGSGRGSIMQRPGPASVSCLLGA